MFVYSLKGKQLKLIAVILFVLVSVIVLGVLSHKTMEANSDKTAVSVKAANAEERVAFLSQFGWEINEEPFEVAEVIIPAEFDETYSKYNAIQTAQGFDLTRYAGKRVKRWTYEIVNYPDYESKSCIRANLLVFEGQVIGGDVCSVELGGFMHGFDMPDISAKAPPAA